MIIKAHDVQNHHIVQKDSYEHNWQIQHNAQLKVLFELRGDSVTTTITCIMQKNAQLELIPVLLSSESELHINLHLAESAHASVKGAYALNGVQKSVIRVNQHHQGKESISHVIINGVARDAALVDYAGMISIEEDARKSVASQENKTMLWSDTAKAQSIPSLEVKTNDVQCAHGSAIGYLNKEHIWYAQTRGMNMVQAQELLLKSFFCQTLPDSIDGKIITELTQKIVG